MELAHHWIPESPKRSVSIRTRGQAPNFLLAVDRNCIFRCNSKSKLGLCKNDSLISVAHRHFNSIFNKILIYENVNKYGQLRKTTFFDVFHVAER